MLQKNKYIMIDLIQYLTEGIDHQNQPVYQDSSGCWNSPTILNLKYKFLKQYDEVDNLPDDGTHKCVPVLIVQNTDIYKKSKEVLYKGKFVDLISLFNSKHIPQGYPTKKIHFYVVPFISATTNNVLGTLNYDIIIDYDTEYDIYGLMAKEINQIIINHYYREKGNYIYNIVNNDIQMYFVPKAIKILDDTNTRFHRIWQYYNIRVCTVR